MSYNYDDYDMYQKVHDGFEQMYGYATQVYEYIQECYNEYPESIDTAGYKEYEAYYQQYSVKYEEIKQEYYQAKEQKDYLKVYESYYRLLDLQKECYERSATVKGAVYRYYEQGSYGKTTPLYRYVVYLKLYDQYHSQYFTKQNSYNVSEEKGYGYTLASLPIQAVTIYPHKQYADNDGAYKEIYERYTKYGTTIPIMVSAKLGDDGRTYYHILDGYYMYKVLKEAKEKYIPAVVYANVPEEIERKYLEEPYFGNQYKNYR
ncbi:hypothetical protein H6504_02035 [Candidatus Woesearchaeota archaeon]|nr:hypothetical protein [Candidatus Woesearchaeota archaeon]